MREFYLKKEFRDFLVKVSKDREVALKFGDIFGKRPQVLSFPGDIIDAVRQNVTSFHISEERWEDPMLLSAEMTTRDKDNLRKGWDMILDIDCKVWEYSKLTGYLLVEALRYHDIQNISVKFSGNKGFHIGVCFESFPNELHNKTIKNFFPDGLRIIAGYLSKFIKEQLMLKILEKDSISTAASKAGLTYDQVLTNGEFDPFKIIDIDTVLIASRHMFRAPFSLHEKSGLVSIPIDPSHIMSFDKDSAKPERVKFNVDFLNREKAIPGEASNLLIQALDWHANEEKKKDQKEQDIKVMKNITEEKERKEFALPDEKISEEYFPPCIKKGLLGLEDGKKRFIFVLINFLKHMKWEDAEILETLKEWNKKNQEPLRENYLLAQFNWTKRQPTLILPANCSNNNYYKDLLICIPDGICNHISNPVNYSRIKNSNLNKKHPKRK